ncbi:MAG: thioredoxin family protein, partial [Longimicrobiales bacterium]
PRLSAAAAGLAAVALAVFAAGSAAAPGPQSADSRWEPYSEQRLAELRAEARPVFVDFTAAWCLSCQVNERVALNSGAAREAFAEADVALLKADWTSRDPATTQALQSFGRSGVPLYVLYPAGGSPPEILPALLTPGMIVDAVRHASSTSPVDSP